MLYSSLPPCHLGKTKVEERAPELPEFLGDVRAPSADALVRAPSIDALVRAPDTPFIHFALPSCTTYLRCYFFLLPRGFYIIKGLYLWSLRLEFYGLFYFRKIQIMFMKTTQKPERMAYNVCVVPLRCHMFTDSD